MRWSILDRCSSTDRECWAGGGRNQASGRSVFVYCLGVDLQTLRLSADFSAAFGFFFFMIHLHLITDNVVVLLLLK